MRARWPYFAPGMDERNLREAIVEIGRRLYERGYIVASDGNISVRLPEGRILTTPTGVCKGFLTPQMLVVVDSEGRKLEGTLPPLPNWPCIWRSTGSVRTSTPLSMRIPRAEPDSPPPA
ncbi:MAG: class II aldolase/adducin family protein [Acidobacteriota bacterium]|nr:class II aldolase/adducin family protein [Acidobacteriota bacterium]